MPRGRLSRSVITAETKRRSSGTIRSQLSQFFSVLIPVVYLTVSNLVVRAQRLRGRAPEPEGKLSAQPG